MEDAIVVVTRLLLSVLFFVVLWRHRVRYCYTFATYLSAQMAVALVTWSRPELIESWVFFASKEALYSLLRLLLLVELTVLIFRTLPRARRRALLLLIGGCAILAAVLAWSPDAASPYRLAKDLTSRLNYVTAWGFISLLGLVVWYRLPLHRLHKAILHGMLWLSLAMFAAVFATHAIGSSRAGQLYNLVQIAILAMWVHAAWMPEPRWDADELAVIRYLQPWRAT